MRLMRAQGATEYLVLLAVVLIVALVSVALLGFFPGMASDAQATQSQAYWQSASPIAITEWAAAGYADGRTFPYFRMRNTGTYQIRITKVLAGTSWIDQFGCFNSACGSNGTGITLNISSYYVLGPGEEKYFYYWPVSGYTYGLFDLDGIRIAASSGGAILGGASSLCSTTQPYGVLVIKNFGFEYIEYVDNNQITKREIGTAPLIIKCKTPG